MHRLIMIAIVSLGLFITAHGHSNVWNGIRPLHSTQLEVEKRWGSPVSKAHFPYFGDTAKYQIEGRLVTFKYSSQSCDGGWNVPKGTVLTIEVPPSDSERQKSAAELKIDESKFFVSGDDAFYGTWTNPDWGVQYYFMNMSQELQWVRYVPRRVDNSFRCDGFPPYVPEAQYYAFESTRFFDPRDGKDGGFDSIVSVYLFNLMYQMKERKGAYHMPLFSSMKTFHIRRTKSV